MFKQYVYMTLFFLALCLGLVYLTLTTGCTQKVNEFHITNSEILVDGTGVKVNKGDDTLTTEPQTEGNALGLCVDCHDISENITLAMGSMPEGVELGDLIDEYLDRPDPPKPEPQPEPTPPPEPPKPEPPKTTYSNHFDHTNQRAFQTSYFAIIFCRDTPHFDSCEIEGNVLQDGEDEGRPMWTNRYRHDRQKGPLSGDLVCTKGNKSWTFKIDGNIRKQCGDCRHGACN